MEKVHLSRTRKKRRLAGWIALAVVGTLANYHQKRRLAGWIALAVVGTLANYHPAQAAPATISASPSEVVVPFGKTSGTSDISYNAGDNLLTQIWMSVDGGPQTLFANDESILKADVGTKTATIEAGKTYTFKMFRGYNTQKDASKLLATVTVVGKQTKLILIPIEPIGFINNVKVEPHGNFAKFTFTTPRSSLPVVMVSTKAPNAPFANFTAKGTTPPPAFNKGDVASTSFALIGTNHASELRNLQPNTTYHYVIEASDKGVGVYRATGTFTTLKRKVVVKFDSITVTDDSDLLGAGELSFGFFINGQHNVGGEMNFPSSGQTSWSSDDSKSVNMTRTLDNAPAKLTLKVTGFDDDEFESPFTLATCGLAAISDPNKSQNGENSCGEWTSTSATFDLENTDPEDTHPTVPFTLVGHEGGKSELGFEVRGSYTVSYSK